MHMILNAPPESHAHAACLPRPYDGALPNMHHHKEDLAAHSLHRTLDAPSRDPVPLSLTISYSVVANQDALLVNPSVALQSLHTCTDCSERLWGANDERTEERAKRPSRSIAGFVLSAESEATSSPKVSDTTLATDNCGVLC